MNKIEVSDLVKYYGNKEAVKNINFKIKENEIIGLLGPNGCGKTTTIGMIGIIILKMAKVKTEMVLREKAIRKMEKVVKTVKIKVLEKVKTTGILKEKEKTVKARANQSPSHRHLPNVRNRANSGTNPENAKTELIVSSGTLPRALGSKPEIANMVKNAILVISKTHRLLNQKPIVVFGSPIPGTGIPKGRRLITPDLSDSQALQK